MRHYFIDENDNEVVINITSMNWDSNKLWYECQYLLSGKELKTIYLKEVADKLFGSKDGLSWEFAGQGIFSKELICNNLLTKWYRGYLPSGALGSAEGELRTKMPGKVVKVLVKEGEEVSEGQTLVIIEAMKMENEIKATGSAKVKAIYVEEGMALDSGFNLMELEN